jgi:hypothetical protein
LLANGEGVGAGVLDPLRELKQRFPRCRPLLRVGIDTSLLHHLSVVQHLEVGAGTIRDGDYGPFRLEILAHGVPAGHLIPLLLREILIERFQELGKGEDPSTREVRQHVRSVARQIGRLQDLVVGGDVGRLRDAIDADIWKFFLEARDRLGDEPLVNGDRLIFHEETVPEDELDTSLRARWRPADEQGRRRQPRGGETRPPNELASCHRIESLGHRILLLAVCGTATGRLHKVPWTPKSTPTPA